MKRRKSPMDNRQDAVLLDYRSSLVMKDEECGALHMFFSPDRIPVGLTDEDVRICINLYPLRKSQENRRFHKALGKSGSIFEDPLTAYARKCWSAANRRSLPKEFDCSKIMTRSRFKKAVWAFLKQAHL